MSFAVTLPFLGKRSGGKGHNRNEVNKTASNPWNLNLNPFQADPTLNPSPTREGLISPSPIGEGVREMGSLKAQLFCTMLK